MPRVYPRNDRVVSITVAQDDTSVVGAVDNRVIRIVGLVITSGSVAATSLDTFVFRSMGVPASLPNAIAATTAISGSLRTMGMPLILPISPNDDKGWFETARSASLYLSTTSPCAAVQVNYVLV